MLLRSKKRLQKMTSCQPFVKKRKEHDASKDSSKSIVLRQDGLLSLIQSFLENPHSFRGVSKAFQQVLIRKVNLNFYHSGQELVPNSFPDVTSLTLIDQRVTRSFEEAIRLSNLFDLVATVWKLTSCSLKIKFFDGKFSDALCALAAATFGTLRILDLRFDSTFDDTELYMDERDLISDVFETNTNIETLKIRICSFTTFRVVDNIFMKNLQTVSISYVHNSLFFLDTCCPALQKLAISFSERSFKQESYIYTYEMIEQDTIYMRHILSKIVEFFAVGVLISQEFSVIDFFSLIFEEQFQIPELKTFFIDSRHLTSSFARNLGMQNMPKLKTVQIISKFQRNEFSEISSNLCSRLTKNVKTLLLESLSFDSQCLKKHMRLENLSFSLNDPFIAIEVMEVLSKITTLKCVSFKINFLNWFIFNKVAVAFNRALKNLKESAFVKFEIRNNVMLASKSECCQEGRDIFFY